MINITDISIFNISYPNQEISSEIIIKYCNFFDNDIFRMILTMFYIYIAIEALFIIYKITDKPYIYDVYSMLRRLYYKIMVIPLSYISFNYLYYKGTISIVIYKYIVFITIFILLLVIYKSGIFDTFIYKLTLHFKDEKYKGGKNERR